MFLKYSLADASGCLPIPSFYVLLALCFYYYVFVHAIFLNVPIKIIIIFIFKYFVVSLIIDSNVVQLHIISVSFFSRNSRNIFALK